MVRQAGDEAEALAEPVVDIELAAEQGDPLGHPGQAEAAAGLGRRLAVAAAAVIGQRNAQLPGRAGNKQFNLAGAGVTSGRYLEVRARLRGASAEVRRLEVKLRCVTSD